MGKKTARMNQRLGQVNGSSCDGFQGVHGLDLRCEDAIWEKNHEPIPFPEMVVNPMVQRISQITNINTNPSYPEKDMGQLQIMC